MRVLSLLGSQHVQDDIARMLKRVTFVTSDCQDTVAFLSVLEQDPTIEASLISRQQLLHVDVDAFFQAVRTVAPSLRLVLLTDDPAGDRQRLENTFAIHQFLPAHSLDGHALERALFGEETPAERPSKVKSLPTRGPYRIGIFGTTHGAGVTSMTVTLAEAFAGTGASTIAVELTGNHTLSTVKGKAQYVCEMPPEPPPQFTIVDFGVPFHITPEGIFMGKSIPQEIVQLLQGCDLKVCMAFAAPWQIQKAVYFMEDRNWRHEITQGYVFLFDSLPQGLPAPPVPIFERNDPQFAERVAKLFLGR